MENFLALLRKSDGTAYGVEFPDFPGCIAVGETLNEAVAQAREALEFHIEGMAEDGEAIPEPGPFDLLLSKVDLSEAVPMVVSVSTPRQAKRVNITIDEGLLERIDVEAAAVGTTRSGFLA